MSDNAKVALVVRIMGGSKSEESTHNGIPTAAPEVPSLAASEVSIVSPLPLATPVIDTAFEQQMVDVDAPSMQQLEQMAKVLDGKFKQQIFKSRKGLSCSRYAALDTCMPGPSPPPPRH